MDSEQIIDQNRFPQRGCLIPSYAMMSFSKPIRFHPQEVKDLTVFCLRNSIPIVKER